VDLTTLSFYSNKFTNYDQKNCLYLNVSTSTGSNWWIYYCKVSST